MTRQQIDKIIEYRAFKDSPLSVTLKETHISWVILTEQFAYKIKKPVAFSFLDFSTLKKRKYYCDQEVVLNQRLAKDAYIDVVPIKLQHHIPFIEGKNGEIIDYAVKMKRLESNRQMDQMLLEGTVNKHHLFQLANQLATFHTFSDETPQALDLALMQDDFKDIAKVVDFIQQEISESAAKTIAEAITFSQTFLESHRKDIKERYIMGLVVDGHGDLHSGNIFLLNQPVIFDCIEFNPHYREMDILSELAFLCMDLEFYGQEGLSTYFIGRYNINYPVIINEADRRLFLYYKMYRANIRIKVNALRAKQKGISEEEKKKHLGLVEDYYHLFKRYFVLLKQKQKDYFSRNNGKELATNKN